MAKMKLYSAVLVLFLVGLTYSAEDKYHPRVGLKSSKNAGKSRNSDRDWNAIAQEELRTSINNFAHVARAKNVILFIGDGMGVSTVTAARHYYRQRDDLDPDDAKFAWDKFPATGLAMTYNADRLTPDSAGTATAFLCGEKSNYYTLGVNDKVHLGNCSNVQDNKLRSAWKHAMDKGKAAGIVTTTRITHATPAGAYASASDRGYEAYVDDTDVDPSGCDDIAYQLIHDNDNKNIQVILGGGRLNFLPNTSIDEQSQEAGHRIDNRTLFMDWQEIKGNDLSEDKFKYVETKEEFDAVDTSTVDYLFGLLAADHMSYELERDEEEQPSLAEMVEKAIQILDRKNEGYFLLVEGGRIDHAHHDNLPKKSLTDVIAMHDAVEKAQSLAEEDTLIIVTADHSHVFSIVGYPEYDADILGIFDDPYVNDDKPMAILAYINGPGYAVHRMDNSTEVPRKNLTGEVTNADDFVSDAGIPISWESHAGEEVAVYAVGPMSYLFTGTHEQHYIAHALMYASCVGDNTDLCDNPMPTPCETQAGSRLTGSVVIVTLTTFAVFIGKQLWT